MAINKTCVSALVMIAYVVIAAQVEVTATEPTAEPTRYPTFVNDPTPAPSLEVTATEPTAEPTGYPTEYPTPSPPTEADPTPEPYHPDPVNGGWSDWGPCLGNCGEMEEQTRACDNPPAEHGGDDCEGEKTKACTVPYPAPYTMCADDYVDAAAAAANEAAAAATEAAVEIQACENALAAASPSIKFYNDNHTCQGGCGGQSQSFGQCFCDLTCVEYGDCCPDFEAKCIIENTCAASGCGSAYSEFKTCQCDSACTENNDCCEDFATCTCEGRCRGEDTWMEDAACQCDDECTAADDCCFDLAQVCGA